MISSQRRSSRSRNTTSTSTGPSSGAGSVNLTCPLSYLALSIFIRKKFYTIAKASSIPPPHPLGSIFIRASPVTGELNKDE